MAGAVRLVGASGCRVMAVPARIALMMATRGLVMLRPAGAVRMTARVAARRFVAG
ncbi:hypothetical protein [Streptomyces sp. IMTB 2501]|uniref:hypothetical protein n=1 Tax=Streptomyces sp. IMTB 2501 TaxID=1776340 RepID=UPI0015BFE5D4|nr:hypothetical protein [Streptomyces sp. IMTB 2501]